MFGAATPVVMGRQTEGTRKAIHAAPAGVRADVLCSVSPRGAHAAVGGILPGSVADGKSNRGAAGQGIGVRAEKHQRPTLTKR
jgi:hypothetical protein